MNDLATAATDQNASVPMRLIEYAMSQNADMDRLEKLMILQERWEVNAARKAYHAALSEFKAEPLTIVKDRRVAYNGKDGKPATDFLHATLGNVVAVIAPALGRHKLSHGWGVRRDGDRVHVTCKLTHALGHSEEITLDGPLDTSGSKNNIQSLGSTITYLERYTLLAITGLATSDQDDDGDGAPTSAQKPEQKTYPQDKFDGNLADWRSRIEKGTKTAEELVSFIDARGEPLTEDQKKTLRAIKTKTAQSANPIEGTVE